MSQLSTLFSYTWYKSRTNYTQVYKLKLYTIHDCTNAQSIGTIHCKTLAQIIPTTYKIKLLIFIVSLKVLGCCIPGLSEGPTRTPPPFITCGTVQLFFDFFLHLFFRSCTKFHHTYHTSQLAPLSSAAPCSAARCRALPDGTVLCHAVPSCVLCCASSFVHARYHSKYHTTGTMLSHVPGINTMLSNHSPKNTLTAHSSVQLQLSSAAQRSAAPCAAVPCPAVLSRAALCFFSSIQQYHVSRDTRYRPPVCTWALAVSLSSFDCPLGPSPPENYTRTGDHNVTSPTSTQHRVISSAQVALGIIKSLDAPNHGPLPSAAFTFSCITSLRERSGRRQAPAERSPCTNYTNHTTFLFGMGLS